MRSSNEVEAELASRLGVGAPAPTTRNYATPRSFIGDVDIAMGVAHTAWGTIPLEAGALAVIVGIVGSALRSHLEQQLKAIDEQLGFPGASSIVTKSMEANARVAGSQAPPLPADLAEQLELPLGLTQGATEGKDAS